ncbi:MAG: hypothetical protein E7505_01995 [Ruminococcus sp.]|nr:hypothetical protein [Ruminococcus sp.]
MEIFRTLAGYSYGGADIVRRAMAKKKHDVMERERNDFIYGAKNEDGTIKCTGAVKNGVSVETANSIFDRMSAFASYAFNKSHAAAYAFLSYQTAYLRCYFFKEYMASIMTSCLGNGGKLTAYMNECEANGIKIIKPSINESNVDFTVVPDGIRFGLSAVKNIGSAVVREIISERNEGGPFSSLRDFAVRTKKSGVSRRMTESLICSGAFDGMHLNRRQMLENLDILLSTENNMIDGQLNLFGEAPSQEDIRIPYAEEYPLKSLLEMELESTGMYMSGHPLMQYAMYMRLLRVCEALEITENTGGRFAPGTAVSLLGIVSESKLHVTKKGDKMCFITLEDRSDKIECVVFPKVFSAFMKNISQGEIIYITGKTGEKDSGGNIIVDSVFSEQDFINMIRRKKLCIKTRSTDVSELTGILSLTGDGDTDVCFYLSDMKKIFMSKEKNRIYLTPEKYNELCKTISPDDIALI